MQEFNRQFILWTLSVQEDHKEACKKVCKTKEENNKKEKMI
jgi:hypothetical protein